MDERVRNHSPEIESQALAITSQARLIAVVDNESMTRANQFNLGVRQAIKDIEAWFAPKVDAANRTHKLLTKERAETLKPLEEASMYITGQVKTYLRKVREEEERQAAILREQARKEAEAEQLRIAIELEKAGNVEEANEILNEEPVYVAPLPDVEIPKVDQRIYGSKVKMQVVDRMAFLKVATPELLIDILNEQAWASIESGLTRKAKALGRRFCPPGTRQVEV